MSNGKERDELDLLIETYEVTIVNAIGLRSRIEEMIFSQEYNVGNIKNEVLSRMKESTEKFLASLN
ncbi:MAG: hypothetical protein ACM3JQ_02475 [Candidatus Eiseniibacteriota bacterium]